MKYGGEGHTLIIEDKLTELKMTETKIVDKKAKNDYFLPLFPCFDGA